MLVSSKFHLAALPVKRTAPPALKGRRALSVARPPLGATHATPDKITLQESRSKLIQHESDAFVVAFEPKHDTPEGHAELRRHVQRTIESLKNGPHSSIGKFPQKDGRSLVCITYDHVAENGRPVQMKFGDAVDYRFVERGKAGVVVRAMPDAMDPSGDSVDSMHAAARETVQTLAAGLYAIDAKASTQLPSTAKQMLKTKHGFF